MCLQPKYAIREKSSKWNWGSGKHSKYKIRFITRKEYYQTKIEERAKIQMYKIPCGKCTECITQKAKEWGARAYMETLQNSDGIFLTLSYNNENLPRTKTGEPTLKKRDITLFKKKLRKHTEKEYEIRTFECGEYGELEGRPHYHMIIWGWKPKDGRIIKYNITKDAIKTSSTIEKIWGKGIIVYGEISYESAMYCARYTRKKILNKWGKETNQEKTFINMSRRPALGTTEWIINKNKYKKLNAIYIPTKTGTKIQKLPRIFYKKWEEEIEQEFNRNIQKEI